MSIRLRRVLGVFDPRGRISASAYRHRLIRLLLAFFGLLCLSIWLASIGLRGVAIPVFGSTAFVCAVTCAQTARRLHDRDRTAWWLGLYALVEALSVLPVEKAADSHPVLVIAGVTAMLGYFAWFVVETLLRPGTPGPNRYGPAPVTAGP